MTSRELIAAWLLVTVLLAPVLGLAVCVSEAPAAHSCCMASCAMKGHGTAHRAPAPCCQRKAPVPAVSEPSAQIVAPARIAPMPAAAPVAMLTATPAFRAEKLAAPPPLTPPLLLLCTLLI